MYHAAYRWLAWLGLWLLIAANARADAIGTVALPVAKGRLPEPLLGIYTMVLVLCLLVIVIQARGRMRARRVMAESQRKRPPFPS